MSSGRKRNHYIPRFFLNRFASRRKKSKHWIWQVGRDEHPREISTRDAAVSAYFYGGEETTVERSFASAEARFSDALRALDGGGSADHYADVLRELVWTLALRTLALRRQFAEAGSQLISTLVNSARSEGARRSLGRAVRARFDAELERVLSNVEPQQQQIIRQHLEAPGARERLRDFVEQRAQSPEMQTLLDRFAGMIQRNDRLLSSARDGQIQGLARLLESGGVPESFTPSVWSIHSVKSARFILGDACVVAEMEGGEVGSIMRAGHSWQAVYLPISSSAVLVGKRNRSYGALEVNEINEASAKLARSYIFSSRCETLEKELSGSIGTMKILTEDEMARLARRAWRDFDADERD